MGGLIGVATNLKNGLMSSADRLSIFQSQGYSTYEINDADRATNNGIYRFNAGHGTSEDKPILTKRWGTLINFIAHEDTRPNLQIFVSSDNLFAFRQNYEGAARGAWNVIFGQ